MPHEPALDVDIRRLTQAHPDQEMAGLAGRRFGVVSRAQLLALGMSASAIDRRVRGGRLHLLHRGVYAVGHRAVPREGRWLAAVLRVGDGAVLSHRSAAELWGILRRADRGPIDVTAPQSARSSNGIRRHEAHLGSIEMTMRRYIPVTTLSRTLFDVAAITSDEGLEAAIRQAEYLHRFRLESLETLLRRHPGERGAKTIRACLRRLGRGPHGRTRARLETRFAALIARTDLPKPDLNVLVALDANKIEADCLWRDKRVIVELDGARTHGTRGAFESDRERDRRLQAAGWRVVRVTWRQLDEPVELIADLRALLTSEPASDVA